MKYWGEEIPRRDVAILVAFIGVACFLHLGPPESFGEWLLWTVGMVACYAVLPGLALAPLFVIMIVVTLFEGIFSLLTRRAVRRGSREGRSSDSGDARLEDQG